MTTFTWTVSRLDCYPQSDDKTNVVFNIHWRCTGTDGTHEGTVYSTASIPAPTDSFTEFADLTQEQVLGWVWTAYGNKDNVEEAVQAQIDAQINPPVVSPALPWNS